MPSEPAATSRSAELPAGSGLRSPRGFWRLSWRRFRLQRLSFLVLCALLLLVILSLLAPLVVGTRPIVCRYKGSLYFPFLAYYWRGGENAVFHRDGFHGIYPRRLERNDPDSWAIWPLIYQDPYRRIRRGELPEDPGNRVLAPPSFRHLFGTDDQARDVFARVVFGTRVALLVGLLSMTIAGAIGILLGSLAGYFGGKTDLIISRLIEVSMSIPTLILILALMAILNRPGVYHLILVIGLTRWDSIARYTRGEFLRLRTGDFVLASRGLGAAWYRIVFSHILPNALTPIFVVLPFGVANAILVESALSFLGFGVRPPTPSWGEILSVWMGHPDCWWLVIFPGLMVFGSVFAFNLVGDGLQEATNPRSVP